MLDAPVAEAERGCFTASVAEESRATLHLRRGVDPLPRRLAEEERAVALEEHAVDPLPRRRAEEERRRA